jgi:hypothetical protein
MMMGKLSIMEPVGTALLPKQQRQLLSVHLLCDFIDESAWRLINWDAFYLFFICKIPPDKMKEWSRPTLNKSSSTEPPATVPPTTEAQHFTFYLSLHNSM